MPTVLFGSIGNSAGDFAKSRRAHIERDATAMYKEVHPEAERLPQATLNLISCGSWKYGW
ncbi:MAG: hypothetical protein ABI693_19885 [Bryobacteraceae bacterium]